ncbi:hypothetical protein Sked_19230 [Sanguibacter keddieii DSM 10542]|uniref:DUF4386 family protein n=1 Tax=Sanguibacter keddieii (strain ATCC 51767 / DSM 10542 / NCFB 3025 / ST-74) TaxID=446469 RepID=D1BHC8_SANKS|nr:hypothetical protein [Sanguibacter keddieii]ACZ21848.1 hypothetical protein Sked_19230 [Sanguibacter keddieii DSM 10542]
MTTATRFQTARARWAVAVGYVTCWVAGLLVGGPQLGPDATAAEIGLAFSDETRVLVFAVLVHGAAAAFLVLLGLSLSSGRTRRPVVALATIAAVLSLDQLAGEVSLAVDPYRTGSVALWEMVSRVDGVKMLVLAALVGTVCAGAVRRGRALMVVTVVTAVALVLSGIGYLTLSAALMGLAAASLPLLLAWVVVATAATVGSEAIDDGPSVRRGGWLRRGGTSASGACPQTSPAPEVVASSPGEHQGLTLRG